MSDQPTPTWLPDALEELARTQHDLDQTRRELDTTRTEADQAIADLRQARTQLEHTQYDATAYRELADAIGALASDGWDDDAAEVDILTRFIKHLAAFHPDCPGRFCDDGPAPVPGSSRCAQEFDQESQ